MKKVILTKKGYAEIKKEYDNLINVEGPKNLENLQEARSMGDLSENAAYSNAKEEQLRIGIRTAELEEILKTAEVVEGKRNKDKKVSLGEFVTLVNTKTSKEKKYEIVGAHEADPVNSKISYESPLGSAIIGKSKGDIIKVESPRGTNEFKIKEIAE